MSIPGPVAGDTPTFSMSKVNTETVSVRKIRRRRKPSLLRRKNFVRKQPKDIAIQTEDIADMITESHDSTNIKDSDMGIGTGHQQNQHNSVIEDMNNILLQRK